MVILTARQYRVSDIELSECYFIAPNTGDLLVAGLREMSSDRTREIFRRLGVCIDAPEWNDGLIFAPMAMPSSADAALAGRYAVWQQRERRVVGFLRSFMGLNSLARRTANIRPSHNQIDRQIALDVLAKAGPGPVDECLTTSFVQARYLLRSGIDCTLSIGCWTPTINMHAWVSVAGPDDPLRHRLVSEPFDRVSIYRPSLQFEFRHANA